MVSLAGEYLRHPFGRQWHRGVKQNIKQTVHGITVMCRLTTGIRSEKCVVSRFHHCANVIERT
jgi:hypothetical protein